MEEPKRSRPYQTPSKNENAPKLPLECRIPIFKFLPTSELVRFVSKSLPLLGEYWSHDLKFVLEQRLPFGIYVNRDSILLDSPEVQLHINFVLVDCLRNKIADIKHPELFQFSSLCELTEHSCLPSRFHSTDIALGAQFGYELLAPLTNLRSLSFLFVSQPPGGSTELPLQLSSLSADIQQVLSQVVKSLKVLGRPYDPPSINTLLLRCFDSLKRLDVGLEEFCAIMPVMVPFRRLLDFLTLPQDGADTLVGLDSLSISIDDILNGDSYFSVWEGLYFSVKTLPMRQILHFLGTTCSQLSELSLPLSGEVSIYMPVFRAMPNLLKLALNVQSVESNGLIDCEGPSITVKELSIAGRYRIPNQQGTLLAILAKLPCVHMLSINVHNISDTLQLAADVLSRQLFPSLVSLKCIPSGAAFCYSLKDLQPLLEHPNLPLRVFILPSKSVAFVAEDPDFLVSLYRVMKKTNSTQFLLMKGPLHPQALVRLEEVLSEDRKMTMQAKVLAWTDKDLPEQRGILGLPALALPYFTDVRISGVKTAGPKSGDEFTIRICHQHTRVTSYII